MAELKDIYKTCTKCGTEVEWVGGITSEETETCEFFCPGCEARINISFTWD